MTTDQQRLNAPHWRRPSAWLAIALLALSYAMVGFSIVSLFAPGSSALPDRPDLLNFLATVSVFVTMPTVGAILAILRPRNPIGWLFLVGGFGFISGIFSTEYVGRAVDVGVPLPGFVLVDWIGAWASGLAFALLLIWVPLLFPDGQLPGPRWRPYAWVAAVMVVVVTIGAAFAPNGPDGYRGRLTNPVGFGGPLGDVAVAINGAGLALLALFGLISIASVAVRFRRARVVERQQLKWFLLAAGYLIAAMIAAIASSAQIAWYALELGFAALPIAVGIAVLRYRLYDIDRIVSRTISYAAVTGVLAITFAMAILLFQTVLAPVTGRNTVAVAGSTLIVAALFQPLRRRVQRLVDRRFNRSRYDAERTVAAFSTRLRDDVDLESLGADVQAVVAQTVAPVSMVLWTRPITSES
jgi:hypothetical protein